MNPKKPLVTAAAAWAVLSMVSFWAAIIMGWGPAESEHDPASLWMYVRRGLLCACAILLPLLAGGTTARGYGWKISVRWLCISVLLGIAMGYRNPGGFDPRQLSAVALACMHAFATELFFRAYLISALSGFFKKFWPPVLISALMYGLFYLTVWNAWNRPGMQKIIFVCLFTGIGIIYGYCYKKSRSFLVPWILHFFSVLKYGSLF
jgi:membrane protease YdiL (CAAX protease family)